VSFRIFTYYTENTPYEQEADNLQRDCERLKIAFEKFAVPSTGEWVENTMIKPTQISVALDCFSSSNIVWIDADARIKSYPHIFDEYENDGIDFSVFQMGSQKRVTSGTIFMRNVPKVREFIHDWRLECRQCMDRIGDQHCLRKLIKREGYKKYDIKYRSLPYSYCYIFDDSLRRLAPNIPPLEGEPVVVHTQASRKYRNKKL